MNLRYSTDIVIFGGGIAGLWMLKRLQLEGYQAILIEKDQLGCGQTLASQGIIHGGLKFALSGNLGKATNAIADMPARWRSCLAGEDPVDLSHVKVLNDRYYMWSASSYRSKLKTFLGSKSLQGRVESVNREQFPEAFAHCSANGSLYQLPDFVIDSNSLIEELSRNLEERIFQVKPKQIEFVQDDVGNYRGIHIHSESGAIQIECSRLVFSAGEGNADLIARCELSDIATQNRPLHMVYLAHKDLPQIFVHCIGDNFSMTPMLTVTSHRSSCGETVWYLGGELAESGVGKTKADQIGEAQAQLAHYFSWIDTSAARWESFPINRAESKMPDNSRPDDAALAQQANIIVAFPTKFTLTPGLADNLIAHLEDEGVSKSAEQSMDALCSHLPRACIGLPRWHTRVSQ